MTESPQNVKSAQRTLELLEAVAHHEHGVTFVDLADELPYPKSSLHGLLQTIVAMGWLNFDPDDRTFSIGVKPWEIGQSFRRSRDIVIHARPAILAANAELDETVQLGILDDLDVVYVDKAEGTKPLRLVSNVGSRLPAYVTGIGKALLGGVDVEILQQRFAGHSLPGYTSRTITSGDELLNVLAEARAQGYAVDDGEYTDGVFCVAVPIVGRDGQVVAAMSCSVPKVRIESGDMQAERMIEVRTSNARAISAAFHA